MVTGFSLKCNDFSFTNPHISLLSSASFAQNAKKQQVQLKILQFLRLKLHNSLIKLSAHGITELGSDACCIKYSSYCIIPPNYSIIGENQNKQGYPSAISQKSYVPIIIPGIINGPDFLAPKCYVSFIIPGIINGTARYCISAFQK